MINELAVMFVGKEFSDSELLTDFLAVIKRRFKDCQIREMSNISIDKAYFFVTSQTKEEIAMITVKIIEKDNDIVYQVTKVSNI